MGDLDGKRTRYYSERKSVDESAGNPLHKDVSESARRRLMHEITRFRLFGGSSLDIVIEFGRLFDTSIFSLEHGLDVENCCALSTDEFLTLLEITMATFSAEWRYSPLDDGLFQSILDLLQSILADDLSAFRFVENTPGAEPKYLIKEIDNEHLDREIVDRTFELTRNTGLASAQRDYAEAWKHYSKGDFDDALVNAHKAFESAAKIVIKGVDPTSAPEAMQTNQLVPELRRLEIIPSKLANMLNPIAQVFQNAGALRNAAGTGHGSVDLASPEANVALLGLHLSGSLVFYLAQRWESMKPTT